MTSPEERFETLLVDLAAEDPDAESSGVIALSALVLDRQLDSLYAGKFPKRCNSCDRVYRDHAEYLASTREMRRGGTIFDDEDLKVQEYRDCACGSTLLVLVDNRRDESEFGQRRRRLFDEWLTRLVHRTGRGAAELRPMLRRFFRAALERARQSTKKP